MNKYTVHFTCLCPNDNETISYKTIIETTQMIMVEDINDYVFSLSKDKMYQEDVTEKIATKFKSSVTTFGSHQGVEIECKIT